MIRLTLSTDDKNTLTQLHSFVDKGVEFQMPNIASLGTGRQFVVVFLDGEVQASAPFRLLFEHAVAGVSSASTFIEASIFSRARQRLGADQPVSEYLLDEYSVPKVPVRAVVFQDGAMLELSSHLELIRRAELEGCCLDDDVFTAVPGFQFQQAVKTLLSMFPGEAIRLQWMMTDTGTPVLVASVLNVSIYTGGLIADGAADIREMVQLL